ncbi:hypothetical protein [Catenovulum adriaticum]|uniref:HDOD domain-containing protein n=1 Tax=Catenovulum adriaticum TaxID=2984846 RepID=A0ABY7AQX9_9ALTE|nr:hypothetical protein [Catenovulum sp. TS8]WAJ70885.1 hypothetical protein OLW01_03485 [Catenovulum sp. TS8]
MSVTTADLIQSTFRLLKSHQKLHQDALQAQKQEKTNNLAQPISLTQWIAKFRKISTQWLTDFYHAPELISSFYFLPTPLKLNQQRYLKTNILLLNFINELNLPKALAIELLTASAIRDSAIYPLLNQTEYHLFELIKNKPQTNPLINIIYKSASKTAQFIKPETNETTQNLLINSLLTNQYEFIDGSGVNQRIICTYHPQNPIALSLFSFCCHLVNLDILYPKLANWTLKLKFLSRHWFQKVDTFYLNLLHKQWQSLPLGSLINYHNQAGYLLFKYQQNKSDYAIIYAQDSLHTCHWDSLSMALPSDFAVLPDQTKLLALYKTQLPSYMSALELNFNSKPKHNSIPKIQLSAHLPTLQLVQNLQQANDPIDFMCKQLNQSKNQTITQDLIDYTKQKSSKVSNNLSVNQAIMMLGSDAIAPWLVQNTIEKPMMSQHHQSKHWLQCFQLTAQHIAEQIALDAAKINPQTARLLVSFALLPYFYHSKINTKSAFPFKLSTDLANIFSLDKNYAQLSQQIAVNWRQPSWLCQALINNQLTLNKLPRDIENSLANEAVCLLKISFFATVITYQSYHLKQMNDLAQQNKAVYDDLNYSMSRLNITWQNLLTLIDNTSFKHHFFCPIAH